MIKDVEYLAAFEREYTASQPNDLEKNLELFEAMWQEAKALGVIPLKDPLEGIEVDIRIAKILNRQA